MDSLEMPEDLVPAPSEKEVLAQYNERLKQWGNSWVLCRLTASLDVAIQVCGQRPLHPDRTLAEEAAIWQHFADSNGGDDAALGEFGPKPTADAHPDAAEHDARARVRRDNFMRQQTTRNQTPKIGGVPGTLRDDLIVPPSGPEPEPIPDRTTFAGYAPPEAARAAPTSVEPVSPPAPPVYEAFDLGDDKPALTGKDELDGMSAWLGGEEVEPTPRAPLVDNVPPADAEGSLWAALAQENQDAAPDPDEDVLDLKVAEQAIEYPVPDSPDPPVTTPKDELFSSEEPPRLRLPPPPKTPVIEAPYPVDEDIPPPETVYRTRSRSSLELRLLLGAVVIGFGAFLVSQVVRREPTRLGHPPDVPAVCLLPQALDQLPPTEQARYIDCQLPHEARPSFHCRAPRPNTEAAQIELCTRAWRTCAPPFGTAISPDAQAACLARVAPPSFRP
jgi:hypothetical protein